MKRNVSSILKRLCITILCLCAFCLCVQWIYINNVVVYEKVDIYDSDYFQYAFLSELNPKWDQNDDSIAIVGLTKLGEEQEVLHVPQKIDGHSVKKVGVERFYYLSYGVEKVYKYYPINFTKKIKKLFVYDNVISIDSVSNAGECDLMMASVNIYKYSMIYAFQNMYVYGSVVDKFKLNVTRTKAANVVFMNNYPGIIDSGYYGLDYTYAGHRIEKLLDPELEGYQFAGWFTEPECINEWDFNQVPVIDEEFILYAGWDAL